MKKCWKNAKKTGKVREIRQSKKVGTMDVKRCYAGDPDRFLVG